MPVLPMPNPAARRLSLALTVALALGGCTSVQRAAQGGDVQAVAKALAAGKDVNMADARGRSLLAIAAENGQLAVMRELIARGADLERPDADGMTPLYLAAGANQLPAVQELVVAGANVNSLNTPQAMTPLFPAAESGYKAVVEYLLSRGAKADLRAADGQTALSRLARVNARSSQSDGPGTAQLLIAAVRASGGKKGFAAYVNQADSAGFTALHRAAASNNAALLPLLLQQGARSDAPASVPAADEAAVIVPEVSVFADPSRQLKGGLSAWLPRRQGSGDKAEEGAAAPADAPAMVTGWSPLLSAALHCQAGEASVKALLAGGAQPLASASNGRTALQLLARCAGPDPAPVVAAIVARARGAKGGSAALRQHLNAADAGSGETALLAAVARQHGALVDVLLGAGADANQADKAGLAPLHVALAAGQAAPVQRLLAARANPDRANPQGVLPLVQAVEQGQPEVVQALLAGGARVNVTLAQGGTPLHRAVAGRNPAIVQALLAARAAPDARDGAGKAPLHLALDAGDAALAGLLLGAGASPDLRNSDTRTPLVQAVQAGDSAMVGMLLQHRADPDALAGKATPLYWAVQNNRLDLARQLLAARANPDIALEGEGWTPLHKAGSDGNTAAYEMLLAAGANRQLRNREQRTPDDLVRERAERLAREAEAERQRKLQAEQNSFQWGKFAALAVGAAAGGIGELDSATQANVVMGMMQDSMAGQQGVSNMQSAVNSSLQQGSGAGGTPAPAGNGPQDWTPEPEILGGSAACPDYDANNYKQVWEANKSGPDVQLHSQCAAALNYYAMYLNARQKGYTKEQARVTYDAYLASARTAKAFYDSTR